MLRIIPHPPLPPVLFWCSSGALLVLFWCSSGALLVLFWCLSCSSFGCLQEIAVLAECRSQYITEYFGSEVHGTKLWIAMEFMAGGSVADLVRHSNVHS